MAHENRRKLTVVVGAILLAVCGATTRENPTVVVGTFDSRAVLMAYVGSDAFKDYLSAQKADVGRALDRAKAAGDQELVANLDALGPAMQKRIHQQGFGTAPVDYELLEFADSLHTEGFYERLSNLFNRLVPPKH